MATREFVITGDSVQLIDRTVIRAVPIKRFMDELKAQAIGQLSLSSGLIPPGMLAMASQADSWAFVFQTPPGVRTMKYQARNAGERAPKEYPVSLPWLQWYVMVNSHMTLVRAAVTGSTEPVLRPDVTVYQPPLPNLHTGGAMCTGSLAWPRKLPFFQALPAFVESMWETIWNDDLAQRWRDYGLVDNTGGNTRLAADASNLQSVIAHLNAAPPTAETWLSALGSIGPEVSAEPIEGIVVLAAKTAADKDIGLKIITKGSRSLNSPFMTYWAQFLSGGELAGLAEQAPPAARDEPEDDDAEDERF